MEDPTKIRFDYKKLYGKVYELIRDCGPKV